MSAEQIKGDPPIIQHAWKGAEPRQLAAIEGLQQRANEGQRLLRSMSLLAPGKAARTQARRLNSPTYPQLELIHPSGVIESVR